MSGALSKRQQARNERTLQDLIKSVPGNGTCADCGARNPGWASWSLGVFLCMRCAALHRKLGTHISKVKSLSMDSWSNDQVENMKKIGNTASNQRYNPSNTRLPIPVDADEVDSVMERFIRQKYSNPDGGQEQRRATNRTRSGGRRASNSSDDQPPPLPPKQASSRFGFRSASSIFPMSSKSKREAAARQHLEQEARQRELSNMSQDYNKAGRDSGLDSVQDMDSKMETLREMGFTDDKKNQTILQGLNGNLDKSIETLVRLGGKSKPVSGSRTPVSSSFSTGLSSSAGITVNRTRDATSPAPSNNPWENRVAPVQSVPVQSAQSTGNVVNNNPFDRITAPSNPFGLQPSHSHTALNQQYQLAEQFQNISVSPQQPLFPHHTGGQPARQPYQPSFAPPLPTIPQGQYQDSTHVQPQQQHLQQNQAYNPFQQQTQQPAQTIQQIQASANPYAIQTRSATFPLQAQQQSIFDQSGPTQQESSFSPAPQSNPFQMQQQPQPQQQQQQHQQHQQQSQAQLQQQQSNPFGYQTQAAPQLQAQQHNNPYGLPQPQLQPQQFQQQPANPWASQNQQAVLTQPQQQYSQAQFQAQPQQLTPQQTGRAGKTDIMALFNEPYKPAFALAPQAQSDMSSIASSFAQNQAQNPNQQQQQLQQNEYMGGLPPQANQQQQARSVSSPLSTYAAANRNPFMSQPPGAPNGMNGGMNNGVMNGQAHGGPRHVSQESMSLGAGAWGVQNGRHSPDAFANLSAKSFR